MKIGLARQDITPPIPIFMAGYKDRKAKAQGINDPLFAKALVMEDNRGKMAAIISIDLLFISKDQTRAIRENVADLTSIKGDHIIICATHTHSGPLTFDYPFFGEKNNKYVDWLLEMIPSLVLQATRRLKECKLGWYQSQNIDIGKNRRNVSTKSETYLTLLSFVGLNDNLLSVLINYNCHPTVLSADNLSISSDYPGAVTDLLERVYGKDVLFMFSNGACGDISTRFTRRNQSFSEKDRLGRILGGEVIKGIEKTEYKEYDSFNLIEKTFRLKERRIPAVNELDEIINKCKEKIFELENNSGDKKEMRVAITALQGSRALRMLEKYKDILEYEGTITVLSLGKGCIVIEPAELFSTLGSKIIHESPFDPTMIIGYSNGSIGYLPDKNSYLEGGYEVLSCRFECGSGEKLTMIAIDTIKELYE